MAELNTDTDRPAGDRWTDWMRLGDIVHADVNPRDHDLVALRKSIVRFGFADTPELDERTRKLVAGHGRLAVLEEMRGEGQAPPSGVRVADDGSWLVPISRGWASRSDAEAVAYLVSNNRQTELARWEMEGLADLLTEINEVDPDLLEAAGYDSDDLAAILDALDADGPDDLGIPAGRPDPDDVPDVPEQPVSVLGDVWLLGKHRLMCGNSNEPGTLETLTAGAEVGIVYTDPPYGISIVSGSKVGGGGAFGGKRNEKADGSNVIASSDYRPVAGDESVDAASDAFRLIVSSYPSARHVWWGGNHYAASAGLPDSSCWLVWDKENTGNFADAELAWTNHPGAVRLLRHMWNGMVRASERGKRVHPTQKPVALAEWAFGVVDPNAERQVVLDVFGGSGSTLIAAHQTKRTALICELEPHYVDVIARRFQEHTGIAPVLEATGKAHDFTKAGP